MKELEKVIIKFYENQLPKELIKKFKEGANNRDDYLEMLIEGYNVESNNGHSLNIQIKNKYGIK